MTLNYSNTILTFIIHFLRKLFIIYLFKNNFQTLITIKIIAFILSIIFFFHFILIDDYCLENE